MLESFDHKHCNPVNIPEYRSQYIDIRIKWFIESYGLRRSSWPLDCIKLLKNMDVSDIIPLRYGFLRLSEKNDAITSYIPEHGLYIIHFNSNKIRYPFKYSRDRRINFTICHEIGHIVLGHLKIPRCLKSTGDLDMEEEEANEFAARLLLPGSLLYNSNYYSLDGTAQYFNVSRTALWKRLNNIKRLDLLSSSRTPSCPRCGSTRITPFPGYCGICGLELSGRQRGVPVVCYDKGIPMDMYKRVITCPRCGSTMGAGVKDRCRLCGLYIFNFCMSYFDDINSDCSYANHGSFRFCQICGRPTYYYKMYLLKPWQEELDELMI